MPETPRKLPSAPCSRPCSETPAKRVASPWKEGLAMPHSAMSGGAAMKTAPLGAKA